MPKQLLEGLQHFRDTDLDRYRELYDRLANEGQHPQVLFISCSDSRVVPNLLTGTGPGDLFIIRTIANIVLPPEATGPDPTLAAVEFAVLALGVSEIVVCGHSRCGGMAALYDPPDPDAMPNLAAWLRYAEDAKLPPERLEHCSPAERDRLTVQRNVVLSLDRLAAHPLVKERRAERSLILHGWTYDIATQEVAVLDPSSGAFTPADEWMGGG